MQCPNCSAQIEDGAIKCPHCEQELAVTVLSRQERDNFNGITIEGDKTDNSRQYSDYEMRTGGQPRFKRINLSFDSSNWTGKLIVAAILVLMVFFFLPLLVFILLVVGAALIGFWLLRMLRR